MPSKTLLTTLLIITLATPLVTSNIIFESPGQIRLGLLLTQCSSNLTTVQNTLLHSAIWTVDRINTLNISKDYQLGLTVYQVCFDQMKPSEEAYLSVIFDLYKSGQDNNEFLLGVLVDFREDMPTMVPEFADILKIDLVESEQFDKEELSAVVKVLEILQWSDSIEIIVPDPNILKEFYRITRREWMCVNRFHLHETFVYDSEDNATHPIVFIGSASEISKSLKQLKASENITEQSTKFQKVLLVPLDSKEIDDIKDSYYILHTTSAHPEEPLTPPKIILSTILFEVASPILQLVQNMSVSSTAECQNSSQASIKCLLKSQLQQDPKTQKPLSQKEILKQLKLESLSSEFQYLLKTSNSEILRYSIFEENITLVDTTKEYQLQRNISTSECFRHFDQCLLECENFKSFEVSLIYVEHGFLYSIRLRSEPWVYAFFSLSLLGIIFCLAIMGFILSRLCKKQVLEGNPILTILLLIDVIVMFLGVLSFSLEGNKTNRYKIYILRAICVTIPYTFAFALLLSRAILLATVSSEVGFMSHVAGSVQGFLALFIFAVQCALSIQLSNKCNDPPLSYNGYSLLTLMSYNIILLILLVFITPMIVKSKRNYREGKYFTIAIILCACAWSAWVPSYAVLDEAWKDPLLCLGLVSTGSILLGGIFIPRTYMMTVSAARDRFTSALPSLATATSAMDIYRASTQPVYDCVNVAAIAAANLRAQHEEERRRAAFYSAPDIEGDVDEEDEENEFTVQDCDSPPVDKVTRF